MRFKVKNSNIFPLPGNPHMLHMGTIGYGLREFIIMYCNKGPYKGQCYIEEAVLTSVDFDKDVYASCKFIDDDALANDLTEFAREKKLLDMEARIQQLLWDEVSSFPSFLSRERQ